MNIGLGSSALAIALALAPAAPLRMQGIGYRPANLWGGYSEKEIRPGVFRVTARYNTVSGGVVMATAAANYRSAELMKQRGFAFMRVLKYGGFELGSPTGALQSYGQGPGYAHLLVRGAAGPDDRTGCEMNRADRCETLSVDVVLEKWRPFIRK
ncbi:hypothetical protein [Sphingomonas sp. NIBR02145]|uniref:hypothetical protein n=1 Tax=Sphingomonas sp. NIBR02145 TaxID=3014784 RepID=UPI0022B431DD|nr:hypothetical protein [Sphingomonas sp. NIBR02145]WHU04982.1 hypothetical protein O3305_10455 [Sphingomonas sp. NIBR02145]